MATPHQAPQSSTESSTPTPVTVAPVTQEIPVTTQQPAVLQPAPTSAVEPPVDNSKPRFTLPTACDNPDGWGPVFVAQDVTEMPYQSFNKGDRLGRSADWSSNFRGYQCAFSRVWHC